MLEIQIDGDPTHFTPGGTVCGRVDWHEEKAPEAIEVRLLWYTEGRGDTDVGVARMLRVEAPAAMGSTPLHFECPRGPLSFSGRLISLQWCIEATAIGPGTTTRAPLVIGSGGEEIDLTRLAG